MNIDETEDMLKTMRRLGMRIDDGPIRDTAEAWALILDDTRAEDAREAVVRAARIGTQFPTPHQVIEGVRTVRLSRLEACPIPPPNVDPDDVEAWMMENRAIKTAIMDGRFRAEHVTQYRTSGRQLVAKTTGRELPRAPKAIAPPPDAAEKAQAMVASFGQVPDAD